jgi:hypothetical protein
MLLLRTAIAFRSPLLKRLDQVLRQVTYYQLCHRSLLRRRISQFYRFDRRMLALIAVRLADFGRPPFELRALGHSIGWLSLGSVSIAGVTFGRL